MAFVLIAVVVVVKTNPKLVEGIKRKFSNKHETSLLRSKTRSEAEPRGELQVSVQSITGLENRRDSQGESVDGWEIDEGDEASDAKDLAKEGRAEIGHVAAGEQQQKIGILEQTMKFLVYEDQPEVLQLFVHVRSKNDPHRTRHLAVAQVPATCAMERGHVSTPCPLTLHSTGEPIGAVHVSVCYKAAKGDVYGDAPGYGVKGPVSKGTKTRLLDPLTKASNRVGSMLGKLPGLRKKQSVWDHKYAEEDEEFSVFL